MLAVQQTCQRNMRVTTSKNKPCNIATIGLPKPVPGMGFKTIPFVNSITLAKKLVLLSPCDVK